MLPFYGDVELMRQAVASIKQQDDPAWRLFVLDDGNPDPSIGSWLAGLGDSRIRYLRNESNGGINHAFQSVLELASADYVVFMGCDDIMLPNYVRLVRRLANAHPQASMIHPGVRVIDEQGHQKFGLIEIVKRFLNPGTKRTAESQGESLATGLLIGNWAYFPAMCWRREPINRIGFRPGLQIVQDLALMLDLVSQGHSMVVDPDIAFLYRRHRSSLSSIDAASGSRFLEEAKFFRAMRTESAAREWRSASRAARLHMTSRLHAASRIPRAMRTGHMSAVMPLLRHICEF